MTPEALVIEKIRGWVSAKRGKVIKVHQTSFSEIGTPDLIVMTPLTGITMVEVKAKGKLPTKIQIQRIIEIKEAGGQAFWCDSLGSFIDQLL